MMLLSQFGGFSQHFDGFRKNPFDVLTRPRQDVERIFSETVEMLREATELRQQHHTDDLYDYLPVAEVPLD